MFGIVIVAHCQLADEYLAALEHVVGHQSGIRAICIESDYDRVAKQAEICQAAEDVDTGNGVIMVTDMHGGSPSNLSLMACSCQDRRVVCGANLPLLLKLAKNRHKSMETAIECAIEAGRKYIHCLPTPV